MAQKTKKAITNTSRQIESRKGNNLKVMRLIVVAVLIVGALTLLVVRQNSTNKQQDRFNTVRPVLQSFKSSVQQQLGSSVTSIKENDYCTNLEQGPFDKGKLWCAIGIEGATNELPGAGVETGGWVTSKRIDAIAHDAFSQAGIPTTRLSYASPGEPRADDVTGYDDYFYVYGTNTMRCDVIGDKPYVGSNPTGKNNIPVGKNQLYFTLSCEQRSSKKFFQYYSSN